MDNDRELRGQEIANTKGQVKRINEESYKVISQSGKGEYEVLKLSQDGCVHAPTIPSVM